MNATINTLRRLVRKELWIVCAAAATLASAAPAQESDVDVTDLGTVTLTVKDTDLAQVLEMLAIQSRKNIITSKNVSGTISANLYDVTFYEALDAILRVNGYGYLEEGSFIYVYTGPELDEIQTNNKRAESRVFELEHLSAMDAFEFVTPLLSESGRMSVRGDVPTGFKPDIGDGGADSYAFTPRIVVNDFPEVLDAVEELIDSLDVAPQQVLVEATILQAQLDERNAFGIDFSVIGSINFTDLTRPLSVVDNLLNGSDDSNGVQPADNKAFGGQTGVGNTAGEAGLKIGILTDDISVFLRVLDEVTDSVVLARPKIMCLNRQRAEVLVGARIGFLSTTATETSTTQSVEFLDTGIQLVFRPFISRNGMVRMELAPSVSEASLRSVTDANGLIVTIPDELTNELTTNVRVPDGQTLVLGGLFRESTRSTRRQVPVLGDIPIVGAAFRGHDDEVDRNEIMFLITPTIIEDDIIGDMGAEAMTYIDAARVGARNGLLPFSRDRIVNDYNRDAIEAYQRGDIEQALYYTNASLRLKSIQPEMSRFREQLTGGHVGAHEQALLERILRRKLGALEAVEPDQEARFQIPSRTPEFLGTKQLMPPAPADDQPAHPVESAPVMVPSEPRPTTANARDEWEGTHGRSGDAASSGRADASERMTDNAERPAATPRVRAARAPVATIPPNSTYPVMDMGTSTAPPSDGMFRRRVPSGNGPTASIPPTSTYPVMSPAADAASRSPFRADGTMTDGPSNGSMSASTAPAPTAPAPTASTPSMSSDTASASPSEEMPSFDEMHRSFLRQLAWPTQGQPSGSTESDIASGVQFDTFDAIIRSNPQGQPSTTTEASQPEATSTTPDSAESSAMPSPVARPSTPAMESSTPAAPAKTEPSDEPSIPLDDFHKAKAAPVRESSERNEDAEPNSDGSFPIDSFDVEEDDSEPIEVREVPVSASPKG